MQAVTLNWIGLPWLEVDIDVIITDPTPDDDCSRVLVTRSTLETMAESIRTSEIASVEDDAAYADSILATEQRPDGFYDVTDQPALEDQLIEDHGFQRVKDGDAWILVR